jgi:hypothetical protein
MPKNEEHFIILWHILVDPMGLHGLLQGELYLYLYTRIPVAKR